jgi:hypothetical protein
MFLMSENTTIVYITDNDLDARLAEVCQQHLVRAADGKRIISVSQKPMDFGENICVGDIGRSSLSIDIQLKAGLDKVDTPYVAVAEHDCLYSTEHFNWIPPDKKFFYYNVRCWSLQYHSDGHPEWNGLFSFRKRRSYRLLQSQLIASTEGMLSAQKQKIKILSNQKVRERWPGRARLGEPGIYRIEELYRVFKKYRLLHVWEDVVRYARTCKAKQFKTKIPNIDVRHGKNLTGARRGYRRRFSLDPWGTMEDILNVNAA